MIRRVVYIWLLCVLSCMSLRAEDSYMPVLSCDSLLVENISTMENVTPLETQIVEMDTMIVTDTTMIVEEDTFRVAKDTSMMRVVGELVGGQP